MAETASQTQAETCRHCGAAIVRVVTETGATWMHAGEPDYWYCKGKATVAGPGVLGVLTGQVEVSGNPPFRGYP